MRCCIKIPPFPPSPPLPCLPPSQPDGGGGVKVDRSSEILHKSWSLSAFCGGGGGGGGNMSFQIILFLRGQARSLRS